MKNKVYLGESKGWYDFASDSEERKFRRKACKIFGARKYRIGFYNGTQVLAWNKD